MTSVSISGYSREMQKSKRKSTDMLDTSSSKKKKVTSSPSPSLIFSTSSKQSTPSFICILSESTESHWLIFEEEGKITATKDPKSPHLIASIDTCPHRLIDTCSLKFVEFGANEVIPPYAILSHRWSKQQEVVYIEYLQPQQETFSKSGYQKIKAACRQARGDDIHYIWVDTCCIEQGNHKDVVANITSMYAYYQNAQVCYAYLADIQENQDMIGSLWDGGSEWFRRGWTLQELLAPRTVIFFNKQWQRIGDKHGLRNDIHQRTTIPRAVLSGKWSIQNIDVLTRMSWTVGRGTTKPQDEAYCLQGLLGVAVEPDYDELKWTAFNRLGKALFDAQPEVKERLGIRDDPFHHPHSRLFYDLLHTRFFDTRRILSRTSRGV